MGQNSGLWWRKLVTGSYPCTPAPCPHPDPNVTILSEASPGGFLTHLVAQTTMGSQHPKEDEEHGRKAV